MNKPHPDLVAAGQVAGRIHAEIGQMVAPGVNLLEIETAIKDKIKQTGMKPAFLGYKSYPAVSCLSVNSIVVHGIPTNYKLRVGDVLSVDLGVTNNGWIVDTADTHAIGAVGEPVKKLLQTTRKALDEAILQIRPGSRTGDIGAKVQEVVEKAGFFIIKELTGHGVGKELQMPPSIPNFGKIGQGALIKEGMVLAIEPITALQKVRVEVEEDDWTIRAYPDVICAHFEHTVFVGPDGPVILTLQP